MTGQRGKLTSSTEKKRSNMDLNSQEERGQAAAWAVFKNYHNSRLIWFKIAFFFLQQMGIQQGYHNLNEKRP